MAILSNKNDWRKTLTQFWPRVELKCIPESNKTEDSSESHMPGFAEAREN